MKKIEILLLVFIILLAFGLRFYRVTEIPPALNWDEVSIGYNAYSVLKTGKDEWGISLPVHFRAYGEYKLPAQIYAAIPGIAIFGLNELGVRITPVIYGTLTILLMFFLARALSQNVYIGLISAFLLAISPWHIQLTRASFESSFALFWITFGVWLLVRGFQDKKWFIWSMIPFAISMYTYNSARVFTPLFLLVLFIIYLKTFLRISQTIILAFVLFIVLLIPLVPYYLGGEGNSRYRLVSVTDDPGLVPRINENRGKANLPDPLPQLIHNKIAYTSFYILQNYLAHFNPDFLFISGAPHKQHHVQEIGEFYLFQTPFLLLGLFFLFKRKEKFRWLLISWIFLGIIPVSVTNDSIPHALRTLIVIVPYEIIMALGFYCLSVWIRNKYPKWALIYYLIITVLALISFGLYFRNYFYIYPVNFSKDWQYGYQQIVDYIKEHQDEYDEIIFSRTYGEPHMFTLFFLNYDPAKYQNNPNLVRFETNNWVWVTNFDKFYFPDLEDSGTTFKDIIAQNPDKKMLFIGKAGDFPKEWHKLKEINFLDGKPSFVIIEKK